MIAQDVLRAELERRLSDVEFGGQTVVAVLRNVDPAAYAQAAAAFALGLDPERRGAWRRSFTRTVFLAGQPEHVARRHPPTYVAPDGAVAFHGPGDPAELTALGRLLRAFDGPLLPRELTRTATFTVPGGGDGDGARRRLELDVGGLGLQEYLVHLNHVVCEAAIDGAIAPGDEVTLVHVDAIDAEPGAWDYARVATDARDDDRLRLYARLIEGA